MRHPAPAMEVRSRQAAVHRLGHTPRFVYFFRKLHWTRRLGQRLGHADCGTASNGFGQRVPGKFHGGRGFRGTDLVSTDAMSCSYGGTTLATSGTRTLSSLTVGSNDLTVSCTGMGGTASDTATVTGIAALTVTASLNPTTVVAHVGETDLTWSSPGAASCELDDGTSLAASGTLAGLGPFYPGSYDFTVTCENSLGSRRSQTVTVTAQAGLATLCSSETTAPADASALSIGNHTFSVTGTSTESVWGTSSYTANSSIATAVVHDGHVAAGDSVIITLRRQGTQNSFTGTTQHGVTSLSQDTPAESYSMTLVRACREDPPGAPENLDATPNPSTDGSFELTWDAPTSGTTATGYLVYSEDSTSGPLTKTFSALSLSMSGLDTGSYTYKVFACANTETNPNCGTAAAEETVTVSIPDTDGDGILDNLDTDDDDDGMPDSCENRYGFDPLDPADGGTTNTDGDGASNVHECLHGTDPTATPANTVLPDTDGDGMYDAWELNNRLDPDDSADASLDDDGDGHTNLEEFTARTDPQWEDSNPDSILELQFGFNDSYTVEVGMINSGDMLNDILIRNPATGILPSVTDFVLIQKRGGGFDIKDPVAEGYTIPTTLTDITSKATVVDINGDGVKDLVLTGLDSGTATITGADDQVVYGNYYERYSIPEKHIALTATRKKFFEDLSAWIDDGDYFETNVSISTTLDIDEAENMDEGASGSSGSQEFSLFGEVYLEDEFLNQNSKKCIGCLRYIVTHFLAMDSLDGPDRLCPTISVSPRRAGAQFGSLPHLV